MRSMTAMESCTIEALKRPNIKPFDKYCKIQRLIGITCVAGSCEHTDIFGVYKRAYCVEWIKVVLRLK